MNTLEILCLIPDKDDTNNNNMNLSNVFTKKQSELKTKCNKLPEMIRDIGSQLITEYMNNVSNYMQNQDEELDEQFGMIELTYELIFDKLSKRARGEALNVFIPGDIPDQSIEPNVQTWIKYNQLKYRVIQMFIQLLQKRNYNPEICTMRYKKVNNEYIITEDYCGAKGIFFKCDFGDK